MSESTDIEALKSRISELERRIAGNDRVIDCLNRSEQEKQSILNSMTEMVVFQDLNQKVLWANAAALESLGEGVESVTGRFCFETWQNRQKPCLDCPVTRTLKTGRPAEAVVTNEDNRKWLIKGYPVRDSNGRMTGVMEIFNDITQRLRMEACMRASRRFLEIANTHREMKPLLNAYVAEIHKLTGCDAVGIRIMQRDGYIPYRASIGFDHAFHELENHLCTETDACMCVNIIRGSVEPPLTFYSGGSFHQNRTSEFMANLTSSERKRIRGACSFFGFESLALIPIQLAGNTLGLIHVADACPDRISPHQIKLLEDTAMQIGVAIQRIRAEEKLLRAYAKLEDRVKERTRELTDTNTQLRLEIKERKKSETALKLNESRLESLHQLNQMDASSLKKICHFAIERGVKLTQSAYGYLFFVNPSETVLTVHAWSKAAMKLCKVPGMPLVYKLAETGLWGEAVRQRKPVITNDYFNSPLRRGVPDGHVPIQRHMNIPVFDGGKIVAVAGVANKQTDYVENDVRQLELLIKGMWRHIKRKRIREALQQSEEKLRLLTTQLLDAQEKERKRISIELHDELGQALLTLKLQLRAIEKRLGGEQHGLKGDFDFVFQHINNVTENVRRLSRDLSPSILEDLGLVAALHWLVKHIGRHHCIDLSCDIQALGGMFSPEHELIVFRIFQEALTNVSKHARARVARVAAVRHSGHFTLAIEDYGRGFDVQHVTALDASERGLGLAAMEERVRMLGGRLTIRSTKGEGTCLTITVPIEPCGQQGGA